MYFEGAEKKANILIDKQKLNLLTDISNEFWTDVVRCGKAKILSSISNKQCKAFLLSESSLFVWHDRLLIITCGETQLVKSIEFFIQNMPANSIKQVIYQRKNEYFSQKNPSCFGDDIHLLSQYLTGKAYRLGEMDSHHNYIFHYNSQKAAIDVDITYELVAYHISNDASLHLTQPNLSKQQIREYLSIDELLPNFIVDDFVFSPYGYSLNAIKHKQYLTIHITPQAESSYVSIESNMNLVDIAPRMLTLLKPKSFDLLSFNADDFHNNMIQQTPNPYVSTSLVSINLSNGYLVKFANYILPQSNYNSPVTLDISKNIHTL